MKAYMTDMPPPPFHLPRPDGLRLAYKHRYGRGPTIIFLLRTEPKQSHE